MTALDLELLGATNLACVLFFSNARPIASCRIFGVFVGPLSGAILRLPSSVLAPRDRTVGLGIFFTCFYVLMAVGALVAGHLQDVFGSPSAALIAGAAVLAATVPLSLLFVVSANRFKDAVVIPGCAR